MAFSSSQVQACAFAQAAHNKLNNILNFPHSIFSALTLADHHSNFNLHLVDG